MKTIVSVFLSLLSLLASAQTVDVQKYFLQQEVKKPIRSYTEFGFSVEEKTMQQSNGSLDNIYSKGAYYGPMHLKRVSEASVVAWSPARGTVTTYPTATASSIFDGIRESEKHKSSLGDLSIARTYVSRSGEEYSARLGGNKIAGSYTRVDGVTYFGELKKDSISVHYTNSEGWNIRSEFKKDSASVIWKYSLP